MRGMLTGVVGNAEVERQAPPLHFHQLQ
jgi:hypothetical protein